jgi:hypothetical protein
VGSSFRESISEKKKAVFADFDYRSKPYIMVMDDGYRPFGILHYTKSLIHSIKIGFLSEHLSTLLRSFAPWRVGYVCGYRQGDQLRLAVPLSRKGDRWITSSSVPDVALRIVLVQ